MECAAETTDRVVGTGGRAAILFGDTAQGWDEHGGSLGGGMAAGSDRDELDCKWERGGSWLCACATFSAAGGIYSRDALRGEYGGTTGCGKHGGGIGNVASERR